MSNFQLPTSGELKELRKGLRKRKLPRVFDGMWISEPGVGGAVFYRDGDDYRVEWVAGGNEKEMPRKKAQFLDLCAQEDMELVRLEVGWVIAECLSAHYSKALRSIPGPKEAMREAQPYLKMYDDWRHWALVPAGRMKGLK